MKVVGSPTARADIWRRARKSAVVRRLYAAPFLNGLFRAAVELFLPSSTRRRLRVLDGLAAGLQLELNPRWELAMWDGTYEPEVQRTLRNNLDPGMTFYDIGAGIGYFSCIAARLGSSVVAFEPDTENANCLERHVKTNRLDSNVELIRAAVFSYSGQITIDPAEQRTGHGNAHVIRNADPALPSIRCVTVDDIARRGPKPHFIKIDVEGSESAVLRGSETVFREMRPLLLCEIHDEANRAFVESWLDGKGYAREWLEQAADYPRHLFAAPRK